MESSWSYNDLERHFFNYLARKGEADPLYPIKSISFSSLRVESARQSILSNIKDTMEGASTPFFVGLFAASMSQHKLINDLLLQAKNGCFESYAVSQYLLKNEVFKKGIESIIPSFEKLEKEGLFSAQFHTLYKLVAIRFYGCLEEASKELLKLVICHDLSRLDTIHQNGCKIGKSSCATLKARIEQDQRESLLSIDDAYDEHILNKGYKIGQYTDIFKSAIGFSIPSQTLSEIQKLEFSRHLLTHRSGIIDQKYIDETNTQLQVGDKLPISARDMYTWQDSIIKYIAELLSCVSQANS